MCSILVTFWYFNGEKHFCGEQTRIEYYMHIQYTHICVCVRESLE